MEAPGFCILRERQGGGSRCSMDIAVTRKRPTGAAGGQQRHITHIRKRKRSRNTRLLDGKILNYVLQGLALNKWLVQKGVHRVKCVLRIAVFHGNIIPAEGADGTRYSVILEFNVTKIHIYFVPKHFCGHGTQHLPEIRSQAPAYTLTIVP